MKKCLSEMHQFELTDPVHMCYSNFGNEARNKKISKYVIVVSCLMMSAFANGVKSWCAC